MGAKVAKKRRFFANFVRLIIAENMDYNLSNTELFAYACLIFIITGVVCGIIRWNHMCKPFDSNGDYHYPARRVVSFFYMAIILEFPYLLNPMDPDAWQYTKYFGVLYYPTCLSVMFSCYFRRRRMKESLWQTMLTVATMAVIVGLMAAALVKGRHILSSAGLPLDVAVGCVSLLTSVILLRILNWLRRAINKYNTDNYSDVDDFAYRFASIVIYLPLIWLAMMWAIFLSDSRWCKLVVDLITSAWMIQMLCMILHPQQFVTNAPHQENIEDESALDTDSEIAQIAINKDVIGIILRRYREPHLQKSEVLSEIPKGKVSAASKYISQMGYYNLVNMFRLQHAILYKDAHPAAKQDEIAEMSGFSSRTAYYKARKSVKTIDAEIVADVVLSKNNELNQE